jgi:hypothetical protein
MNTNHLPVIKKFILPGLLATAFISVSSGDIIYQDNFTRVSALNGSAPTVDNTGGAAVWTATAGYQCTGTNGLVNNSISGDYQGGAMLPLDWNTYPDPKVQVDVLVTGNFLALVLGDCNYWGYPAATAMLKLWGNGNVDICHGPGWDSGFVITNVMGAGNVGAWNRLRIEYSNSLGTATFYLNGNAIAKDIPIAPKTTGVGFDSDTGGNTLFTNLLVTFGNETVTKPSISVQPQAQTVYVGDAIHLSVGAGGTLPLSYVWRKDNVDIPGPNASSFDITNTAVGDSGNYSVVITNSAGSITSSPVRADVHLEAQSVLVSNNFDFPTPVAYTFAFTFSSSNGLALPSYFTNEPSAGYLNSTGGVVYADGTAFGSASVSYSGFGGGWGQSFIPLPTHNLNFYECYFKARVQNLKDGVTNTPCRLDLRFYAPDGTTGPPDGSQDLVFSVETTYNFSSNFQAYSFLLGSGAFGGPAGQAAINQYQTNIYRMQWEFTAANFASDFVNGPGDGLAVDDARLVYRQSPAMSVTLNGTQPVLHWDDPNLVLQGATNVTGPYVPVTATSPYPVPPGNSLRYYRTVFIAVP